MITLTVEAHDADELMMKLRGLVRETNGNANVIPLKASAAPMEAAAQAEPAAASDVNPKPSVTVDDLKAGMTLKETASTTLGDGSRAAPGDNVLHGGEEWAIYATYRGRVIAATEDNRADVLMAENCSAVPDGDQTPAAPRPGTAAALLNQPDPNQKPIEQAQAIGAPVKDGPIEPAKAAALRERATEAVSNEQVSVDAVFGKLTELGGVSSIDQLTAANAAVFETWLDGAIKPKPGF